MDFNVLVLEIFLFMEIIQGMSVCPSEDLDVVFPHKTDCSKFYECHQGNKIERSCPPGQYFDVARNMCGWTNCEDNPNVSRLEFYNHETDCNKYYMTMKNKKYTYSCPVGLYFDLDSEVCDYPWNVKCYTPTK